MQTTVIARLSLAEIKTGEPDLKTEGNMRGINRLSARFVSNVRKPGRYNDGHGLYLQVDATRKSWLFRYTRLAVISGWA